VPNTYFFTAPKTRVTYMLNTSVDTADNAEAACNLLGGHLAMYESQSEQQEVETGLVSDGGLIPSFHMRYWLGLESTEWPKFEWKDRTVPAPSKRNYNHWDKSSPDNSTLECAAASWPEAYTNAWAWVDEDCGRLLPYVCEISSEWHRPAPCSGPPLMPQRYCHLHRTTCSATATCIAPPARPHPSMCVIPVIVGQRLPSRICSALLAQHQLSMPALHSTHPPQH
jgi:hypothetical protein